MFGGNKPSKQGTSLARGRTGRLLALGGTVIVVAVGLWVGQFDLGEWRRALTPKPAAHPAPPRPEAPLAVVQPRPLGTTSSVSPVPVTLHLVATRPGRNARDGYADIGVAVQSPQTYRAGALLANGARIEEIYTDYVVLVRDERHARLYVEGKAPADYHPSALLAATVLQVGGAPAAATAVADSQESLTDVLRVTPVYEGETLTGLQVYGNDHSDVFQKMGLEPGDRIQSIDGAPVRDVAEAVGNLRHLTEGQSMTVIVERAGHRETLSLDGSIVWGALHGS